MIYLILGENTYQAELELARLLAGASSIERVDTFRLDEFGLSDLMRGATLFSSGQQTVVFKQLSERKDLWEKFIAWAGEVADDTTIILCESKLDKRTKAYKDLSKIATIKTVDYWTDREAPTAEMWLIDLAKQAKLSLKREQARDMVQRVLIAGDKPGQMFIDQMQLARAVEVLTSADTINSDTIAAVLPPTANESIFKLFDLVLSRDAVAASRLVKDLQRTDEPHLIFAALTKQWTQLAMVIMTGDQASQLGFHPFVLSKMRAQSKSISRPELRQLTSLAADLDARLKLSEISPWDAVDRFLLAIAQR